jgi:hypothetical protein
MKKKNHPTQTVSLPAPKRRNAAARVLNQKAQTMAGGPRRQGTRRAREKAALKDQGVQ